MKLHNVRTNRIRYLESGNTVNASMIPTGKRGVGEIEFQSFVRRIFALSSESLRHCLRSELAKIFLVAFVLPDNKDSLLVAIYKIILLCYFPKTKGYLYCITFMYFFKWEDLVVENKLRSPKRGSTHRRIIYEPMYEQCAIIFVTRDTEIGAKRSHEKTSLKEDDRTFGLARVRASNEAERLAYRTVRWRQRVIDKT